MTNQTVLEQRVSEVSETQNYNKAPLFAWLAEYHRKNIEKSFSFLEEGKKPSSPQKPLHKGVLIISNGTLIEKLTSEGVISSEDEDIRKIETKEDFFAYLDTQKEEDCAYLFDNSSRKMRRIEKINKLILSTEKFYKSNTVLSKERLSKLLSDDFLKYKENERPSSGSEIDHMTRLALQLPNSGYEGIETLRVSTADYADIGIGKVMHFNKDGICQEYFLKPYETTDSTLAGKPNEGEKASGVYRMYLKMGSSVNKIYDRPVNFIR